MDHNNKPGRIHLRGSYTELLIKLNEQKYRVASLKESLSMATEQLQSLSDAVAEVSGFLVKIYGPNFVQEINKSFRAYTSEDEGQK